MKIIRELNNKNRLVSETATDAFYKDHNADLSMHFVSSGSKYYSLGNRNLTLYPGNFLVLKNGTNYSGKINSDIPVNEFSISFSSAFVDDFSRAYSSTDKQLLDEPCGASAVAGSLRIYETIHTLTGDMKFNIQHLKQHFDDQSASDMLFNEYFHHSLFLYNKFYAQEIADRSTKLNFLNKNTRDEIIKRLLLAKDYILSNYSKNICLEDISCNACLSVNHLLRTFKQAYQCSPHQFLIQTRLNRARYLLKNTDYPVNEIVGLVGFECSSSFIRLFKNNYNITPLSYRMAS